MHCIILNNTWHAHGHPKESPPMRAFQVKLTETQVDTLVAKMKDMVAKADARFEVTLPMLKRSARSKASNSVYAATVNSHRQ